MADRPERANANVDFAALLKRLRTAAGLTQEELAERASLSVRGISDLERGLKRRPHRETVRLLTAALSLSPEASAAFLAASNPAEAPQFDLLPAPASSLIGRGEAVRAVVDILSAGATRLLTLIGPGGVGKTRLALHLAAELREHYKDGAAFVSLAAITAPGEAPGAVMRALGIKNAAGRSVFDALIAELRAKRLLLVLDNCEQAPFGPFAAALLSACPGVAVIATSRAPLHVSGEQEFEVPSLDLPDPSRLPPLDQLAETEAVALFVARARAVKPNFTLTDANALPVATICARLDGLPLAIELAAVRIKVLAAAHLAELLTERLRILTDGPVDAPARHRTMRAAIAWSADLLNERERTAFRRLAVFSGGCTLEDAAGVLDLGDIVETLDVLTGLVDQSLLRGYEGRAGDARFVMLETIREYASEQLAQSGESADVRSREADCYLMLVERAAPLLVGSDAGVWLHRLEDEHENLWSSFSWFAEQVQADKALRLTCRLWQYWWLRGRLREGRDWLTRALNISSDADPAWLSNALMTLGNINSDLGDYPEARAAYEKSLSVWRQLHDQHKIALTLHNLAIVQGYLGQYALARTMIEESLSLANDPATRAAQHARALQVLGDLAYCEGNYERSIELLTENLNICRDGGSESSIMYASYFLGRTLARIDQGRGRAMLETSLACFLQVQDTLGAAHVMVELGRDALSRGDNEMATSYFQDAFVFANELGSLHCAWMCVEGLARTSAVYGRWNLSARLLRAASAGRIELGRKLPVGEQAEIDQTTTRVRAAIGDEALERARLEGALPRLDQIADKIRNLEPDRLPAGAN